MDMQLLLRRFGLAGRIVREANSSDGIIRRDFLKGSSALVISYLLSGCGEDSRDCGEQENKLDQEEEQNNTEAEKIVFPEFNVSYDDFDQVYEMNQEYNNRELLRVRRTIDFESEFEKLKTLKNFDGGGVFAEKEKSLYGHLHEKNRFLYGSARHYLRVGGSFEIAKEFVELNKKIGKQLFDTIAIVTFAEYGLDIECAKKLCELRSRDRRRMDKEIISDLALWLDDKTNKDTDTVLDSVGFKVGTIYARSLVEKFRDLDEFESVTRIIKQGKGEINSMLIHRVFQYMKNDITNLEVLEYTKKIYDVLRCKNSKRAMSIHLYDLKSGKIENFCGLGFDLDSKQLRYVIEMGISRDYFRKYWKHRDQKEHPAKNLFYIFQIERMEEKDRKKVDEFLAKGYDLKAVVECGMYK